MSEIPEWFNASFIITMTGFIGGGIGVALVFCIKSRCTSIKCGCVSCERDVIPLTVSEIQNP